MCFYLNVNKQVICISLFSDICDIFLVLLPLRIFSKFIRVKEGVDTTLNLELITVASYFVPVKFIMI